MYSHIPSWRWRDQLQAGRHTHGLHPGSHWNRNFEIKAHQAGRAESACNGGGDSLKLFENRLTNKVAGVLLPQGREFHFNHSKNRYVVWFPEDFGFQNLALVPAPLGMLQWWSTGVERHFRNDLPRPSGLWDQWRWASWWWCHLSHLLGKQRWLELFGFLVVLYPQVSFRIQVYSWFMFSGIPSVHSEWVPCICGLLTFWVWGPLRVVWLGWIININIGQLRSIQLTCTAHTAGRRNLPVRVTLVWRVVAYATCAHVAKGSTGRIWYLSLTHVFLQLYNFVGAAFQRLEPDRWIHYTCI